ncbi:MAG: hypothetical protein NVSMB27_13630 [Ktedonobacteraceae bacterium]
MHADRLLSILLLLQVHLSMQFEQEHNACEYVLSFGAHAAASITRKSARCRAECCGTV